MSFINVLFKRVTTAIRGTEAIEDGKILLDYERPSIYVDNGSTRVELTPRDTELSTTSTNAIANNALTNSIINTTAEVSAITADNIPCGTKPVKELNDSLLANGEHFYYDVKDGVRGYNTSPARGADTFVPFSSNISNIEVVSTLSYPSLQQITKTGNFTLSEDFSGLVIALSGAGGYGSIGATVTSSDVNLTLITRNNISIQAAGYGASAGVQMYLFTGAKTGDVISCVVNSSAATGGVDINSCTFLLCKFVS